ncbi:MAG: hypothetical protein J1F42_08165 [Lachnospiraceae bacterium]|nr:hypothetical protein [Lachnospiraceae bacterium]
MRIDSSVIGMESSRRYTSVTAKSVTASSTRASGKLNQGLGGLLGGLVSSGHNMEQADQTEENEENGANLEDITTHFKNLSNPGRITARRQPEDALYTIRQRCMQFLMELLFGYRSGRFDQSFWNIGDMGQQNIQINTLTNSYYHMEEEHTTFSTVGKVVTADGRELEFNLEFSMSRRFEQYYEETYTTGVRYCDPLVINLDTNVASVSDQKFFFDLDQDGIEEELSMLNPGSGFLALDLNGDGIINDGGELFGTKSGNGFADLSKYDSDGNGWIDEADEIWDKLLIWTKDEKGNDILYHLSDLGVGAIGLGNISTQFALNSAHDNHNNAMIRNTGIFLYENGNVSTVQHLDLAR